MLWGVLFSLLQLFLLSACIRENRSDCLPEAEERFIVLKVMDAVSGQNLTETGEVGSAEVYLFTPEGKYVGQVSLDSDRIMHHIPVLLPGDRFERYYVSVWANAEDGQQMSEMDGESSSDVRAVSLIKGEDDYHQTPDDLFFGYAQLALTGEKSPEEITIVRKNAKMHITVRGLNGNIPGEYYYFTIQTPNDGYDFQGNLMSGASMVYKTGKFDIYGNFSTQETFNMIHTASSDEVTVSLYEKPIGRATDKLVVSVTNDNDGMPISLPVGRTVNLLIDMGEEDIVVRTEVTPWNEIYQWEIW